MIRKALLPILVVCLLASWASAEAMRPLLTKENKMPKQWHPEVGVVFQYAETPEDEKDVRDEEYQRYTTTPYARVGLLDNLAAFATFPYVEKDIKDEDTERGAGDITAGLELVAWQDLFGFPYVMPHFEVSFDTGDEDGGLGSGETISTVGLCAGTKVMDQFNWAGDLRYAIHSDEKNIISFAASLVWDLGERFSLLAEAKISDRDEEAEENDDDNPFILQGGASYMLFKKLMIAGYLGYGWNTEEEVVASAKASLAF